MRWWDTALDGSLTPDRATNGLGRRPGCACRQRSCYPTSLSIRFWRRRNAHRRCRRRTNCCAKAVVCRDNARFSRYSWSTCASRSEEHTSELQSRGHLVCRLLLEKKKQTKYDQAIDDLYVQ